MKKALFLNLSLLLFRLRAQAQSSFVQPVVSGVTAGINASLFAEDAGVFDPVSSSNDLYFKWFLRVSGFGAITVDYMVTERFSVGAEMLSFSLAWGLNSKQNENYKYLKNE